MLQNKRFRQFLGKIRRAAPLALLYTVILLLAYLAVYSVRTMSAFTKLTEQGIEFMALAVAVMVLSCSWRVVITACGRALAATT